MTITTPTREQYLSVGLTDDEINLIKAPLSAVNAQEGALVAAIVILDKARASFKAADRTESDIDQDY